MAAPGTQHVSQPAKAVPEIGPLCARGKPEPAVRGGKRPPAAPTSALPWRTGPACGLSHRTSLCGLNRFLLAAPASISQALTGRQAPHSASCVASQLSLTPAPEGVHVSASIAWRRTAGPREFAQGPSAKEVAELELKPVSVYLSCHFATLSHGCEKVLINQGGLYYLP